MRASTDELQYHILLINARIIHQRDTKMKKRIVHVDLKGAQPLPPGKSAFWEQWCNYLSRECHVDGILIEWEDCLPISVLKSSSGNDTTSNSTRFVYTLDEVNSIVNVAIKAGLTITPLIQTFGHLEYLLKLEDFSHLREVAEFPDCLAPAENEAEEGINLIFRLIEEVLSFTPDISSVHIGGDEVWHLGNGEKSKRLLNEGGMTKIQLYLQHMNLVVKHLRCKYPHISNIMIWDDMFRSSDADTIKV